MLAVCLHPTVQFGLGLGLGVGLGLGLGLGLGSLGLPRVSCLFTVGMLIRRDPEWPNPSND